MNKESHIYNISSCNHLHMFVFDKNKECLMTFMNVYGQMSDWAIGPPPTPEFHFLIVFAGKSNSTNGTMKIICV